MLSINSCHPVVIVPENNQEDEDNDQSIIVHSYLLVKGNPDMIKDCTPEMTVITDKERVSLMSFSGDGEDWSEWVDFAETYEQFNIASGFYGTKRESGLKTIYVRFKDKEGNIFPENYQEPVCCTINYEMQELFSIQVEPDEIELKIGGSYNFMVKGYDLFAKNEVPLDGEKVEWTKPCGVGKLIPTAGLKTTYTAPEIPGTRNISAHYGSLGAAAKIVVLDQIERVEFRSLQANYLIVG